MDQSPPTDKRSQEAFERCLAILGHEPAALVTDIDGTVSEIAPRPEEATVPEPARDALHRLNRHLACVGVVTGRSAAAAATLVKVPGLTYVGNHGLERLHGDAIWHHPQAEASAKAIGSALVEIAEIARAAGIEDGILAEDKHLSASVHYRLAPDPETARSVLLGAAEEVAARHGLRVTEGRFVVEIRPQVRVHKGTAIETLVTERGLKGVVFLGDDVTDVDAFNAVWSLRELGAIAGLTVGVLAAETADAVLAASDVLVPDVGACVDLLVALADRLEEVHETTGAG